MIFAVNQIVIHKSSKERFVIADLIQNEGKFILAKIPEATNHQNIFEQDQRTPLLCPREGLHKAQSAVLDAV